MSKLCVPITEKTAEAVIAALRELPAGVDIAEIRLDCLDGAYPEIRDGLEKICRNRGKPIIITNRPAWEGGFRHSDEGERLKLLKDAAELGADYVDIELRSLANLSLTELPARRIISYHDYESTPADLELLYRRCRDAGADIVKIATMAADISDSARMLELLRKHSSDSVPVIALCMGEEGIPTRVLAPKFGGYLSFASRSRDKESAPGQIDWADMLGMYRFRHINADTAFYGVAANPVAHSMSPAIHNAAFAGKDINAVYLPLKVRNPETFLNSFQPLGLRGLSVTIPHKEAMVPLVDEPDELTRRVGALNTVSIESGRRRGFNTDMAAALGVLHSALAARSDVELSGCRVLLIGAGGAGRALAHALGGATKELMIANRTLSRAAELAAETGASACGLDEMADYCPDIIINTTSVGMHPNTDETPVPKPLLEGRPVVFDAVYNPMKTRLLREAGEAGCTVVSGFDWFVDQAARQFSIWTGRSAPRDVMAEEVRRRLG